MTTPATIPTDFPPDDLCSESAALRVLNLATSRRDWLRSKLPSRPAGTAMIYRGNDVLALFRQLQADPSILAPVAQVPSCPKFGTSAPMDGSPRQNRAVAVGHQAQPLVTR